MTRLGLWKIAFFGAILLSLTGVLSAVERSLAGPLDDVKFIASTVPNNGDINPYGVAVVPSTTGKLVKGHVLVSNFNNSANLQGTGTTIVDVSPEGDLKLFAKIDPHNLPGPCPGGVGLTTALAVLRSGWVIVGSLPTTDGTAATAGAGCLIVLNRQGQPVETISGGLINGPWDMTAADLDDIAILFVTNVLNGTVAANGGSVAMGTVVRIVLTVQDNGRGNINGIADGNANGTTTNGNANGNDADSSVPREFTRSVIGSNFGERTDPAALVIGPTGVGLGRDGTLYVADTLANRIAAIPNAVTRATSAGTGITVSQGKALNAPLGLAIARNGQILVTNGGDGNLVTISPSGNQVAAFPIDTTGTGAGTLFGLATVPGGAYFVNDGNNTLNLLHPCSQC